MKKIIILTAIAMMGASAAMACGTCGCAAKKDKKPAVCTKSTKTCSGKSAACAAKKAAACTKCGEVKGSEKCCKPPAKKTSCCPSKKK